MTSIDVDRCPDGIDDGTGKCWYCSGERCGIHNFDPCDCPVDKRHIGPFLIKSMKGAAS